MQKLQKKHSLDTEMHLMKTEIERMNMASIYNSALHYSFCYISKSIEENKDLYSRIPLLLASKNLAQPPLREPGHDFPIVLSQGEGEVTEITLSHVIVVLVRMFVIYDQDFQSCIVS